MKDYKKSGKMESLMIDGNLILTGDLEVEEQIEVTGYIDCNGYSIKAGYWIEAGGSIEAGSWIKAGGSIEAGDSIEAGGSILAQLWIKCKTGLKVGIYIYAGVKTWSTLNDGDDVIECGALESGEIRLGTLKELGLPKESCTCNHYNDYKFCPNCGMKL